MADAGYSARNDFVARWSATDRQDRLRIRRLTRMGRPPTDEAEAELAAAYARFQLTRPWIRFFWIWFVPGVVMATLIAVRVHPVVIGIVIALAAQAVFAQRNLRRAARAAPT